MSERSEAVFSPDAPKACDVERVARYEALLNEAGQVLSAYEAALERFAAVQEKVAELNAYYGSKAWWADFEASEAGLLPAGMPCGVLSEDSVWDLLSRNRDLIEETRTRFALPAEPAPEEAE